MELFPDGSHVRLRTSNGGRYLHAKKDGLGTGLRSRRASLLAAWAVQHVVREGTVYLLLRSAAYGRYLGLRTVNAAPATQRICKAVLQLYDHRERRDIHWKVVMVQAATRRVRLQHRLRGTWYSPGGGGSRSWVVEIIPPRLFAPELPEIVEVSSPSPPFGKFLQSGSCSKLFSSQEKVFLIDSSPILIQYWLNVLESILVPLYLL